MKEAELTRKANEAYEAIIRKEAEQVRNQHIQAIKSKIAEDQAAKITEEAPKMEAMKAENAEEVAEKEANKAKIIA